MNASLVNTLNPKVLAAHLKKAKTSLSQMIASTVKKQLGLNNKLKRKNILEDSEKYKVLQFGSEELFPSSEPFNSLDDISTPSLSNLVNVTWAVPNPYVFEVANAKLIGPLAIGFSKDGNLISVTILPESYHQRFFEKYLSTRILLSKSLPSINSSQVEHICSLVNCWGRNYFHWTLENLTKLEGLEYYQEKTSSKPILLLESNPPNWQLESLKLLGYQPEEFMYWNTSTLKVKRLVVPSFRRKDPHMISPSACRWVRQRILSNLPDEGEQLSLSPRVYISRSTATGRRVINEADVLEALTPFGFVAYNLENLSFSDQVRLFSQAKIVIAPHGAGLANIMFSQNLVLLELFGPWLVPCYFSLAKGLGFQYGGLKCDSPSLAPRGAQYSDIVVDLAKLRVLAAKMQDISMARVHA